MTVRLSTTETITAAEATALATNVDQDVSNASSPILAVTNMTGSAAGIDSDSATHIASAGLDHAYVADNLVQVVITATGGAGGSTAGALTVQVNDLAGAPVARAVNIRLDISDTEFAGSLDAAATCQFGAASTGTLVVGSGTASAVITTDATGAYVSVTDNVVDETNYFSASTTDGGTATLANGCVVVEVVTDDATWAA